MTLASKITLVRVAFIPALMVLMYLSGGQSGLWMWISLGVFIVASLTDYIDGYIARKYHQVSDFGKFLDPLADKLLVIAVMVMFCQWNVMPAWALMIVLTREFAVTGLRLVAVGKGVVIAAGVSNMILDYVLMAVIQMGIAGAALATGLSQCIAGLIPFIWFLSKKNQSALRFTKTNFEIKKRASAAQWTMDY